MRSAHPYLNFAGNTEEAFEFYRTVFGGELIDLVRFGDFPENPMGIAEDELDRIAHIALPLGNGTILMGTDVVGSFGKEFTTGTNFYIALEVESGEEADRLFDALSDGGHVEMALQKTEWAEQYGSCTDRFGVQWMVSYTAHDPTAGLYGWITHTEIASSDPAATKAWCASVLGWEFKPAFPSPAGDYHLFTYSRKGGGGIRATGPGEPTGSLPFVHVEDARAAFERALREGAEAMAPPERIMDGVTIAIVRAPGGVPIGFSGP